jgi:hypothetical protein
MAVGASTTGGATIQQLNPATYTQSIAGGALEVDPGGAVSFTVSSSLDVGTGNVHITVNNTSGSLGMTLQYSGLTKQRSGVVGWVF